MAAFYYFFTWWKGNTLALWIFLKRTLSVSQPALLLKANGFSETSVNCGGKDRRIQFLVGTCCLGGLFMWCQPGSREWRSELEKGTIFKVHPLWLTSASGPHISQALQKQCRWLGNKNSNSWACGKQFRIHPTIAPIVLPTFVHSH